MSAAAFVYDVPANCEVRSEFVEHVGAEIVGGALRIENSATGLTGAAFLPVSGAFRELKAGSCDDLTAAFAVVFQLDHEGKVAPPEAPISAAQKAAAGMIVAPAELRAQAAAAPPAGVVSVRPPGAPEPDRIAAKPQPTPRYDAVFRIGTSLLGGLTPGVAPSMTFETAVARRATNRAGPRIVFAPGVGMAVSASLPTDVLSGPYRVSTRYAYAELQASPLGLQVSRSWSAELGGSARLIALWTDAQGGTLTASSHTSVELTPVGGLKPLL